jgi:anti-sigma factor (TIGR02949 family)
MSRLDRTNCEEAFRRLNDFLDRRLTPEEMKVIEEHLEICAWCAREFNFETSVLHGVKQRLRHFDLPPDFVTRVLSKLPPSSGNGG